MSFIELMAAVTIVSILAGAAYMGYQHLIPEARMHKVAHDLQTIADAVGTYNRDHPDQPYSWQDGAKLIGRYLDEIPVDPWSTEYIIDPFLQRVVSRGENQSLQSPVLGREQELDGKERFDDFSRQYGELGQISFLAGSEGHLYRARPDGTEPIKTADSVGADWASQAPDHSRYLLTQGDKLFVLLVLPEGVKKSELSLGGGITGGKDCSWSSDGLKFAFVASPGGAVAVGDVTTGVLPTVITSAVGGAASPWLVPGNRELVFSSANNIYRVAASEQSPLTTVNVAPDGKPMADGARPVVSPDGKRIAYVSDAGEVYVRSLSQARRALLAKSDGSDKFKEVVFSPGGRLVAMTDGRRIVLASGIALPPRSDGKPPPLLTIVARTDITAIKSLSWR
jgi:type II secretory pathway pseudopilin PulG